jgi:recombination protein RecT
MSAKQATTTTIQKAEYSPAEPIGNTATVHALMERMSSSVAKVLPKHMTPDRMLRFMLMAVNTQPKLFDCTQASVCEAVMKASQLGLDCSGTNGEAYLVPFQKGRALHATLIPGYRGLAKLARQSGEIKRLETEVVYEKDTFRYRKGTNFELSFEPSLSEDRGRPIGAYALVELKDGGIQSEFMPTGTIEKIRQGAMSGNSPAWKNHWDEMARKTVFRRLAKWLPISSDKYAEAIQLDNSDFSQANVMSVETVSATDRLAKELIGDAPPKSIPGLYGECVNALMAKCGCHQEAADEILSKYCGDTDAVDSNPDYAEKILGLIRDGHISSQAVLTG